LALAADPPASQVPATHLSRSPLTSSQAPYMPSSSASKAWVVQAVLALSRPRAARPERLGPPELLGLIRLSERWLDSRGRAAVLEGLQEASAREASPEASEEWGLSTSGLARAEAAEPAVSLERSPRLRAARTLRSGNRMRRVPRARQEALLPRTVAAAALRFPEFLVMPIPSSEPTEAPAELLEILAGMLPRQVARPLQDAGERVVVAAAAADRSPSPGRLVEPDPLGATAPTVS